MAVTVKGGEKWLNSRYAADELKVRSEREKRHRGFLI